MRKWSEANFSIFLLLSVFLAGCLSVQETEYAFDRTTGTFQVIYHDVRSIKEEKSQDNYLEEDWKSFKEELAKKDDYNPEVVSVTSKELFKEGDALSAKAVYQVECPNCFPSVVEILKLLHHDEWRWELINNEVFLIQPGNASLISTNGKLLKTDNNSVVVWPATVELFEYRTKDDHGGGESLLPFYLNETGNPAPPEESQPGSETTRCGIENCHGLDITCGPNVPDMCTQIYSLGDFCRAYAQCQVIEGKCQLVENQKFSECKACIDDCVKNASTGCESQCREKMEGPQVIE